VVKTLFSSVPRQLGIASLFQISLSTLGYLFFTSDASFAQVTSDGTVNTQVNQNGNVAEITGGQTRGGNLFHSFRDFSVGTGDTASFLNSNDIANIFSRVTGGNISNIDGLISANGSANLFLINPAGILFGENARLDVGGSFLGSTADSILFEDGEFSATDLDNPPVLTINAPIGLGFRDNPGDIQIQGTNSGNLRVNPDNVSILQAGGILSLVGGDIVLEEADLDLIGTKITLGGLTSEGIVEINSDGSLNFPADVSSLADIKLASSSLFFRALNEANDTNNIVITGNDISLEFSQIASFNGEMNEDAGNIVINSNSLFLQDDSIIASLTSGTGKTGDITIQTENAALANDNSGIITFTEENSKGDAGNIAIQTRTFALIDGSFINSSTAGEGNGGNVDITALIFDMDNSSVFTTTAGQGNAGDVTIQTIKTTADADIDEEDNTINNISIFSRVAPGAVGNGGNIAIKAEELSLNGRSLIDSSTFGLGNAGDINIQVEEINLDGGGIFSQVGLEGEGNGGSINIDSESFSLTRGGQINASLFGSGNAGNINIQAEEINLAGGTVLSQVGLEGEGDGGSINIDSESFSLTRGGQINASLFGGSGNGGSININTSDFVEISGVNAEGLSSILSANSEESAIGNPGSITVETNTLNINGGIIEANNQGQGDSQEANNNNIFETNIFLRSNNLFLNNGASISAITESGDGGNADILVQEQIWLENNSSITVGSFGSGDGGNVNIDAKFIVAFPSRLPGNGNDILASAGASSGGNINVQVDRVFGIEPRVAISGNGTNDFNASAELNIEEGIVVNIFDSVALPPTNLIESEQTIAQACQANREAAQGERTHLLTFKEN
jgi:filamentous hemagglutinin family protein